MNRHDLIQIRTHINAIIYRLRMIMVELSLEE